MATDFLPEKHRKARKRGKIRRLCNFCAICEDVENQCSKLCSLHNEISFFFLCANLRKKVNEIYHIRIESFSLSDIPPTSGKCGDFLLKISDFNPKDET